ncbi:hypothetical protein AGMMS50284_7340 [Clostridia bacterium]|nr:hypothetical protein AGMMS50284_7340 [Clostridia bacterium]
MFDAFKTLTPLQKKVLNDHFMNDLTIAEIARKLDITQKSAWRIKDRAIKALRTHLKKGGSENE